jgi:hypothetical protein
MYLDIWWVYILYYIYFVFIVSLNRFSYLGIVVKPYLFSLELNFNGQHSNIDVKE